VFGVVRRNTSLYEGCDRGWIVASRACDEACCRLCTYPGGSVDDDQALEPFRFAVGGFEDHNGSERFAGDDASFDVEMIHDGEEVFDHDFGADGFGEGWRLA
jgi:hypothetical protein